MGETAPPFACPPVLAHWAEVWRQAGGSPAPEVERALGALARGEALSLNLREPLAWPPLALPGRPLPPGAFDADAYLALNPDVAQAVRRSRWLSARLHWILFGDREGRGGGPWAEADRSRRAASLAARSFGVNLYGFLSARSGLGTAARGYQQALRAEGIPLEDYDLPSWERRGAARPRLSPAPPHRVNLLIQNVDMMPRFVRAYGGRVLRSGYTVGCWVWELPVLRADWFALLRHVDEVWVPSEYCREAVQCLTRLPVRCVPYVVDGMERLVTRGRAHFGLPQGVFVFAAVFDLSSHMERKNPLCVIEAFKRAFSAHKTALLLLKCHRSGQQTGDLAAVEEAIAGAPNIRLLDETLTEEDNASLHAAVDCLVSPHRSEGFGLNLAEAMYLGKPVIATRFSGNLDFMDDGNSYLLDCRLSELTHQVGPYPAGYVWAEPSVEHLAHLLRTVAGDEAGRTVRAENAAARIRRDLSARAVGQRMSTRLDELGMRDPEPPRGLLARHAGIQRHPLFPAECPPEVAREVRQWSSRPTIGLLLTAQEGSAPQVRAIIESVWRQHYPFWELCVCEAAGEDAEVLRLLGGIQGTDHRIRVVRASAGVDALQKAALACTGPQVVVLQTFLPPDALLQVVRGLPSDPGLALVARKSLLSP